MNSGLLPYRFDPRDSASGADPYPDYERLRRAGALCRGGPGQWVASRHADVTALLNDQRLGSQLPDLYHRLSAGTGAAGEFARRIMLYRDHPAHGRIRKLVGQGFTPGAVRRIGPAIAALADSLLAPGLEAGRLEVVADLATPLPVAVICQLIGIPPADRDEVRRRAADLGKAVAATGEPAAQAAADAAVSWLRTYIAGQLAERRLAPRDDLLSRLAAPEAGEGLTLEEIVDNIVFLFFAGFETTTSLIATGCAALLDHPAELARLLADPGLAPAAVEEFLRLDAPIQSRYRVALEPVEIGGRTIRAGRMVLLLIGSANRDERQFARAWQLEIGRRPNPHVSFGGGPHFCLGAALARLEARTVFASLARRLASCEWNGSPARVAGGAVRAHASVPMSVHPK